MKLRHAAQLLSLAAVLAACGAEARVVQPRGCVDGYNRVPESPSAGDVRAGDAWFPALDVVQRSRWRDHWDRHERVAYFKAPLIVPAGGTLALSVPQEARGLLALDYTDDAPVQSLTLSGCYGAYAVVFIPGALRVKRPICRVPVDWRYGDERGRLHLSFGRACR